CAVSEPAAGSAGLRIVLAGTEGGADLTGIGAYREAGGYAALEKARGMEPQAVLEELLAANVRGRGGAGFPMGRKASFLAKGTGKPTYLVVNADESEPGTFKDREIMFRVPHRLIEGCLITAHAIGSANVFVYIRGEYEREFEILRDSLEAMRNRGLLGDVTVVLHRGAGAYICGEETALLESLEGKRGQPRTKPPFPAIAGLYAAPTAVNNVESITTVTSVFELGASEYAKLGVESSTGTRVFSLSGDVVNPGNYELSHGVTLRKLVYDVGGGVPGGRELKAIIPGGSSTPILTAEEIDTPLDFDSLVQAGSSIGSAGVIVIDDRCCMVQLGIRVSQFYEHESCGKCTPCRVGTRWLTQILRKIEDGRGSQADLDLLLSVCDRILGKCLCPLGDSDAIAVLSYVDRFRDEFQAHVDLGRCPFEGGSSLERILAPSEMHERHSHAPAVTA
ncbi:MAG TPA: NADH-quinone oxidoreductase subunit NuoF, partial [Gaiellaceae bacterium]|nr:NADH-quinone oxidoreductase subunit NuoF [Gaiellaceae bacterium]